MHNDELQCHVKAWGWERDGQRWKDPDVQEDLIMWKVKEKIGEGGSKKREVGRREVGRGEVVKGEVVKREVGKREVGKREVGKGEVVKGEVVKAEVGKREVGKEKW